jgi:hypothetical protein
MAAPVGFYTYPPHFGAPPNDLPFTDEEMGRMEALVQHLYPITLKHPRQSLNQFSFYLDLGMLFRQFQQYVPVEEVLLIGSGMVQVLTSDYSRGKKKLKDLDLCLRIATPLDPYQIKSLFLKALADVAGFSVQPTHSGISYRRDHFQWTDVEGKSPFEHGFLKDLCVAKKFILVSLPTLTRGSEAFQIDITIVWEPDASCFSSADCFQGDLTDYFGLRGNGPRVGYKKTADGYDFERSLQLLQGGLFEVDPMRADRLLNGLRGYVRLLTKGLRPLNTLSEPILVAKWLEDPQPWWDTLPRYIHRHYGNNPYCIVAYYLNLRRLLAEHGGEQLLERLDGISLHLLGAHAKYAPYLRALIYWNYRGHLPEGVSIQAPPPIGETIQSLIHLEQFTDPVFARLGLPRDVGTIQTILLDGLVEKNVRCSEIALEGICHFAPAENPGHFWEQVQKLGPIPESVQWRYDLFRYQRGDESAFARLIENDRGVAAVWDGPADVSLDEQRRILKLSRGDTVAGSFFDYLKQGKRTEADALVRWSKKSLSDLVGAWLTPARLPEVVETNMLTKDELWKVAREKSRASSYQYELIKHCRDVPAADACMAGLLERRTHFSTDQLKDMARTFGPRTRAMAAKILMTTNFPLYLQTIDWTKPPSADFWEAIKGRNIADVIQEHRAAILEWPMPDFCRLVRDPRLIETKVQSEQSFDVETLFFLLRQNISPPIFEEAVSKSAPPEPEKADRFVREVQESPHWSEDLALILVLQWKSIHSFHQIKTPHRKFLAAHALDPNQAAVQKCLEIEKGFLPPSAINQALATRDFVQVCQKIDFIRCAPTDFFPWIQQLKEKNLPPAQTSLGLYILLYRLFLSLHGSSKHQLKAILTSLHKIFLTFNPLPPPDLASFRAQCLQKNYPIQPIWDAPHTLMLKLLSLA